MELLQAWEAILEGECVQGVDEVIYKKGTENKLLYWSYQKEWCTASGDGLVSGNAPFRIVKDPSIPERKALAFEEAEAAYLADKQLVVETTRGKTYIHWSDPRLKPFDLYVLCYLDLAARRPDWNIYEVTE